MLPDEAIDLPILENLGFLGRRAVRREAQWFCLPGGQCLFQRGDPADTLYFVVNGALGAFQENRQDEDRIELLGHIRPGEPVGEIALFAGEPHSASVYALRDSEIIAIPKRAFEAIVRKRPEIMGDLARMMIVRMRRSEPRSSAPRVFALISASFSVDLKAYGNELAQAMRRTGCSVAYVDEDSGVDISRLDELETEHDQVLLAAPLKDDVWTHAVLRQADRIWLFGRSDARPSDPLLPDEMSPLARLRLIDVVLLHLGGSPPQSRAEDWRRAGKAARLFHWRVGDKGDVGALARTACGRSVGLVLSGGGARAYAHVGAIRALRERGFEFDFLGGTSMGGIIAAGVAMGWDDAELDRRVRKAFVETSPLNDYVLPVVSLTRGEKVDERLKEHFGEADIAEMNRPFFCVSTNLATGEPMVHRSGKLRRALRASIAIPGLLPPVTSETAVLVDGAVMKNFPADVMRGFHRGPIVGLDVGRLGAIDPADFHDPPNFFGWVLQHGLHEPPPIASLLMRAATAGREGETLMRRDVADLLIMPTLQNIDIRDWRSYDRAVQEGYEAAMEKIDALPAGPASLRPSQPVQMMDTY